MEEDANIVKTTNICRICLCANIKMYPIKELQEIYEKITDIKLLSTDEYQRVCFVCYNGLKQCRKLKLQAVQTDKLLKEATEINVVIKSQPTFRLTTSGLVTLDIQSETIEVQVKDEKIKCEIEDVYANDVELDPVNDAADIKESRTDSEDDVPLKNISSKMTNAGDGVRTKRRIERKINAKEILLSHEEQLQEMLERSKSENYTSSPYRCQLCYRGFVDPVAFDKHREKHDKISGPFECPVCHLRYPSGKAQRAHAAAAHARRYQCAACPHRAHTRNQAVEHEKWHKGHTYACQLCGLKFNKPSTHLTHMRKLHAGEHVCRCCGESFHKRRGLLMHASRAHRREKEVTDPPPNCVCTDCDIHFTNMDAYTRHLLITNRHTLFKDDSRCKVCDQQTNNQTAHERMHARLLKRGNPDCRAATDFRVACQQCESKFTSRSQLQNHVKRVHLGMKYDKDIVCETCGKRCTSGASLRSHQRRHTGERPFACERCPARFASRERLRVHSRSHSGEKPYACALCGHAFAQKPALNRHYRVHTGARPYACHLCGKGFSQSNSLKTHVDSVHLRKPKLGRAKPETPAL